MSVQSKEPKLGEFPSKAETQAALKWRREHKPKQIDNASLHAGSPMYFYCVSCGHPSDSLPESYLGTPKRLCSKCQYMKDMGFLE